MLKWLDVLELSDAVMSGLVMSSERADKPVPISLLLLYHLFCRLFAPILVLEACSGSYFRVFLILAVSNVRGGITTHWIKNTFCHRIRFINPRGSEIYSMSRWTECTRTLS